VIKKLESMGELENTYVIYTADHGIAIGRHGLMGKQSLYEHCWRVPYIVAGPNIAPGSRARGNIYLLDTMATICDLAGINIPETNEGKSFRPILEGRAETIRDVLYGVYCGGTKPGMRCVRKGDWKLIKYETLDGKVKETQLFDLARNPHELIKEHHDAKIIALTGNTPAAFQVDLAEDPRYAGKLKEMEALLLAEMERLDDPYRFDEGYVNRPKPVKAKPRKKKNRKKSPQPAS
jgi:arylsulfatase A-like enzyme